jgi:hypothetical protein
MLLTLIITWWQLHSIEQLIVSMMVHVMYKRIYRGADKSLTQPGRKQATATEDFDFHISYL